MNADDHDETPIGADILAQLGVRKGASIADYPFADESAPIPVALVRGEHSIPRSW
jgi:hypothetical protein